jgi:hypothetical protein
MLSPSAPWAVSTHAHCEASALANDLPEESDRFRFIRAACFANFKGSVGLTLAKAWLYVFLFPSTSPLAHSPPPHVSSTPAVPCPLLHDPSMALDAHLLVRPLLVKVLA